MFDFMFDPLEATPGLEPQLATGGDSSPAPVCIHRCNSTLDQITSGTLMSPRKQTYVCVNCMDDFNRMNIRDRKVMGRE